MADLAVIAVVVGIGLLASKMLSGKNKQGSKIDDSVLTPSLRGAILPMSLGINRISPVIGYVGNTLVVKKETDSGGKGGGGGSTTETITYHQSGLHFISVGEGIELTRIVEGGKTVFNTTITPSSHPSGSSLTALDGSTFRIYWGEDGQPIDTAMAALTGVTTRYPLMMYVVWDRKKLGQNKVWPNIEYEVFIKSQQDTLFSKDTVIDDTIDSFNLAVSVTGADRILIESVDGDYFTNESVITSTAGAAGDVKVGYQVSGTINSVDYLSSVTQISESGGTYTFRTQSAIPSAWYSQSGTLEFKAGASKGLNPMAIIYQLLFETYPHGLGLDTADYNLTDLETIFDYFVASGTTLPASLELRSNKSLRDGIGMVMQDCGVAIAWDAETDQYRFVRAASSDSPTAILDGTFKIGKDAAIESGYAVLNPPIRTYRFTDSNRKYKDSTLLNSDDGTSKYTGMPNTKKISLNIVRDLLTASWVSAYRDRENFIRTKFTVSLSKDIAGSVVGKLFNFQGIEGNFRLADKKIEPDNASVKCTFIEDVYSEATTFIEKEASGLFPGDSSGAEKDLQVLLAELSRFTNPDENGVFIIRVRQSPQIQGMVPYLSDSDVSYQPFELQNQYGVGGKLVDEIPAVGPAIDFTQYKFTVTGPDADSVFDLTASEDEARWRSGEQICIINSEVLFLAGIAPTANPGEYTFEGIIRGRWGTVRETHSVDDDIIIVRAADIKVLKATMLTAGATIYGKSLPFTQNDIMELSEITAESITYEGGGFKPLAPINLNTEDRTTGFETGVDTTFVWGYKNITGGAGAGLGFSDEPYNNPLPEGYFKLEFLTTGDTIVRTETVLVPTYTYTNADRVLDFGSDDFKVKVYNILNSLESEPDEITVEII